MEKSPSDSVVDTFQASETPRMLPSQKYIKYQTEMLGVGSFKRVYKCLNVQNGKEYAWNELALDKVEPLMATKIFQEIAMYKRCNHPNILRIFDHWFNDDNMLIFTTELIHGGSIYQFLHKAVPQIRLSIIQRWATQILDALTYLHANNIIHRDLKSQNVYIDQSTGIVKVGDLGLATTTQLTQIDIDKSKQSMVGTSEFMAPEIYGQVYNEKVDIYSFGLMMVELSTKEFPYSECKHTMEIYQKVTQGIPPEALKRINIKPLQDLIQKATITDPANRPTAKQLLQHEFFQVQFGEECVVLAKEPQQGLSRGKSGMLNVAASPPIVPATQLTSEASVTMATKEALQPKQSLCVKMMKKVQVEPETWSVNIVSQIAGKEQKANFVLSKSDKREDIVQEILNIQVSMMPLKAELSAALGKVFEKWLREGLALDDTFAV